MQLKYTENDLPSLDTLKADNYDDILLMPSPSEPQGPIPSGVSKIGILTSGGDAPGMNAAVRSVARAAIACGIKPYGIRRGYHGLLSGEVIELKTRDVSEKLQLGGTFLLTARSKDFYEDIGVWHGAKMASIYGLDAIVVIGGDGSFAGARKMARLGVPVIGIPATIDNDVNSSQYTIGFDTAMNTAVEAIDRLRETASSHERCSVVEVMGRNRGFLAYGVGMSSGAECILVPEVAYDIEHDVVKLILESRAYGKEHWIVIVAEGAGSAVEIAEKIEKETGIETRATVLGYIQRGGSPTVKDRMIASLMGLRAVDCLYSGRFNRVITSDGTSVSDMDIEEALELSKELKPEELDALKKLF